MSDRPSSPAVEAAAGAAAGFLTEVIFYGLDSYKVMLQQQSSASSRALSSVSMARLFNGTVPIALTGGAPSFAIFFAVYSPLKEKLTQAPYKLDTSAAVAVSSVLAAIPSSLVAVPSDVIKKRMMMDNTSFRSVVSQIKYRELMTGWEANMVEDVPFALLKMSLYEACSSLYVSAKRRVRPSSFSKYDDKDKYELSAEESAAVGAVSGGISAVLTCPLDVINTVMKSGPGAGASAGVTAIQSQNRGMMATASHIIREGGTAALFRGLAPRVAMNGAGSVVFWYFFARCKTLMA